MDFPAALRYLDEHVNLEATAGRVEGLSLERMRALVHVLGDPQDAYPVIHLTGTNGKGSTARMIAALLREAGLSVGLYTSPHLEPINERLMWDGLPIADDDFATLIADLAALEPLARAAAVVLRAAHGSRVPLVRRARRRRGRRRGGAARSLRRHQRGRRQGRRAHQRRPRPHRPPGRLAAPRSPRRSPASSSPDSTFVLGEDDPELRRPLRPGARRRDMGARRAVRLVENELALGGRLLTLRTPGGPSTTSSCRVHGGHQADNAALALAATEAFFGSGLDDDAVRTGFAQLALPGRFEVVHREPTVVLDGAHNPEGAQRRGPHPGRGVHPGRAPRHGGRPAARARPRGDAASARRRPGRHRRRLHPAVTAGHPVHRAGGRRRRARALPSRSVPDVASAVERALALATTDDLVLVTGSLYVVGAARTALTQMAEDPSW